MIFIDFSEGLKNLTGGRNMTPVKSPLVTTILRTYFLRRCHMLKCPIVHPPDHFMGNLRDFCLFTGNVWDFPGKSRKFSLTNGKSHNITLEGKRG